MGFWASLSRGLFAVVPAFPLLGMGGCRLSLGVAMLRKELCRAPEAKSLELLPVYQSKLIHREIQMQILLL